MIEGKTVDAPWSKIQGASFFTDDGISIAKMMKGFGRLDSDDF